MPKYFNKILQFKNYNRSLEVPFTIYADFECMLQKIDMCQPSDETSYTNAYQKHVQNNFAFYIKYSNRDFLPPVEYSGPNAAKRWEDGMMEDARKLGERIWRNAARNRDGWRKLLKKALAQNGLLCQ
jgi:hypothetical protein